MVVYPSFGISDVDRLLGGGIIPGSSYLLEVEPGTEELAFIACFLREGLQQGNVCGAIVYNLPHKEFIDRLTYFGVNVEAALDSGQMVIADFWSEGKYDPERRSPILMTDHVNDLNSILRVYTDLTEINLSRLKSGKFTGTRVAVYSLSSEVTNYRFEPTYKFVKIALNMVRQQNATSLAVLSPKMFDETVVASFEHLYDGVIVLTLKEVKGRFQRFMRVKESPISSFHTDEVPYEIFDNRPSLLTTFTEPVVSLRNHLKFHADGTISMAGSRFFLANIILPNVIFERAAKVIGYDAAAEEVYNIFKATGHAELKSLLSSMNVDIGRTDGKQLLHLYAGYLSAAAWGKTELVEFSDRSVTFRVSNSPCSLSGGSDKPMAPYLAGSLAGAAELILGKPIKCIETKCSAKGDEYCEFVCKVMH
jgi:KaiC/GvpD/RAD55 family RecA-like ATPase/predicted hydrocarbon binding protein